MKSIIIRIVRQLRNDRRTMALMVIAPLLILTLLYFLLSDSDFRPVITVDNSVPVKIVDALKEQDADIITVDETLDWSSSDAAATFGSSYDSQLSDGHSDALIRMDKDGLHIRLLESDASRLTAVSKALRDAMASLNPQGAMDTTYVFGKADDPMFGSLAYMLLGVLSFFFVFVIAGIAFVRERDSGTLERLMITPVSRSSVISGYTLGFGVFTVLQSILMIVWVHYVLGLSIAGSIPLTILIMVLLSFTAVSSGALVSLFANSEFQVMQFIPIVVIPQIFFSGLLAVDTMPYGLGNLSIVMPVYYGCTALKNIILKGYGVMDVWPQLGALLLINLVLFVLNVLALKKYRQA